MSTAMGVGLWLSGLVSGLLVSGLLGRNWQEGTETPATACPHGCWDFCDKCGDSGQCPHGDDWDRCPVCCH